MGNIICCFDREDQGNEDVKVETRELKIQSGGRQNIPSKFDKKIQNFGWNVKDLLGEGSFGKVYKGVNVTNGTEVAVKHMDGANFDQEEKEMLEIELEVMKKCHDKNLIELYHDEQIGKQYYLFLEICHDGDLKDWVEKKGEKRPDLEHHPWLKFGQYFKEEVAVDIMRQLVSGYKVLIANNFIHRDIKPANVLVNGKRFLLADFGFAGKFNQKQSRFNEVCGSPLYESPQILQEKTYTSVTDVWSLGILFYELLFAITPWPCRSIDSYLKIVLETKKNPVRFPYNNKQQVSKNVEDFIQKCLKVDEKDRMTWQQMFDHPLMKTSRKKSSDIQQKKPQFSQNAQEILKLTQQRGQLENLDTAEIFTKIDTDKDGTLNEKEFQTYIKMLLPNANGEKINSIFKQVDTDNSGTIDFKEFQSVYMHYRFDNTLSVAEQIVQELRNHFKSKSLDVHEIFHKIDQDGNKELDYEEFKKMILTVFPKIEEKTIKATFAEFDKNDDKKINENEFLSMFNAVN